MSNDCDLKKENETCEEYKRRRRVREMKKNQAKVSPPKK